MSDSDHTDGAAELSLQTWRDSAIHNVLAYGVVGDGETDDTEALQRAVDAAIPQGVVYVPANCHVRITDVVDANIDENTAERSRFNMKFDGALKPEAGGRVHIQNGNSAIVDARVQGGSGDVDEDCAFRFTSLTSSWVNAWGENYPGTILRFDQAGQERGGVSTMSIGQVRSLWCGRSVYMGPGPDDEEWGFMGGYGQVGDVWEHCPEKAFTAIQTNDLCIDQYENYVDEHNEQGVLLEHCNALWVDKMLIGGNAPVPLAEVRDCSFLNFGALTSAENLDHGGDGYIFDSCQRGYVKAMPSQIDGTAITIDDTGLQDTEDLRFDVDVRGTGETGLTVTENVEADWLTLRGVVREGRFDDTVGVDIESDSRIICTELRSTGNGGPDLILPEDNDTHLYKSLIGEMEGTPQTDQRFEPRE